jgi:hypothetical protein
MNDIVYYLSLLEVILLDDMIVITISYVCFNMCNVIGMHEKHY